MEYPVEVICYDIESVPSGFIPKQKIPLQLLEGGISPKPF